MVNKAIVLGNLGKDPEMRFTQGGKGVCTFSVATSEKWTDQQGQKQERTEWHTIVVWGKQAEACAQYLAKGKQVYVEGSIRTRNYDDKNGVKKYVTEIVATDVRFLGGAGGGSNRGAAPSTPTGGGDHGAPPDDDIPFIHCAPGDTATGLPLRGFAGRVGL